MSAENPAASGRDAPTGRFGPGNTFGRARHRRTSTTGALPALEREFSPAAQQTLAWGRRYAERRRRELEGLHGPLSAGVLATLESLAEALAASRYWSAQGLARDEQELTALGHRLALGASKLETDALALAEHEAQARSVNDLEGVPAPEPQPEGVPRAHTR